MTTTELIDQAPRETLDAIDTLVKDAERSLQGWTKEYGKQYEHLNQRLEKQLKQTAAPPARKDNGSEVAEPVSTFLGLPYLWFDLIAVGPFQPVSPGGPFRPSRIIRTGEVAVLLAAVWRNPFPLPLGLSPSAAQIMAGQQYTVRGQTVDVNGVTDGPDLGPVVNTFGAGNVDIHPLFIPSVPAPTDGSPRLLDISLTIDVRGPASGLPPFAGYASRWLQLDSAPPFVFPSIPGVGPIVVPGTAPGFVNDAPVRVLIYS